MRRAPWAAGLLLAPLLLGGCGASGPATSATPAPSGSPWIVVAGGSPTPSPTPSITGTSRPPFGAGFLPVSSAGATPAPTPSPTCPPVRNATPINSATVVTGTTSATVTWYNPGDNDLVDYRLTAIDQDLMVGAQQDVGWKVITPVPGSCGYLSATITGLKAKTRYVFSVDGVYTRGIGLDGTRSATIARTIATRTT